MSLEQGHSSASRLAFVGLIALYPIFFFYHLLLAFALIPTEIASTVGGLYGPSATIILVILLFLIFEVKNTTSVLNHWIAKLYFSYVIWALFYGLLNLSFFGEEYKQIGFFKLFEDLVLQTSNFLIGSLIIVRSQRKIFWTLFCFWIGMALAVTGLMDLEYDSFYKRLSYDEALVFGPYQRGEFANYQGFSRSFMISSIFLIAIVPMNYWRICISFLSILVMALIGARSELIGFTFAVVMFELVPAIQEKTHRHRLLVFTIFLCLFFAALAATTNVSLFSLRSVSVLELTADSSWVARMDQISDAFRVISLNPLAGDFAVHLRAGNHGDIPHNFFATWTMLGFTGLLLIAILVAGSLFLSVNANLRFKTPSVAWRLTSLLVFMALPQVFLTKSTFVEWLPLVFGAVVAADNKSNEENMPAM